MRCSLVSRSGVAARGRIVFRTLQTGCGGNRLLRVLAVCGLAAFSGLVTAQDPKPGKVSEAEVNRRIRSFVAAGSVTMADIMEMETLAKSLVQEGRHTLAGDCYEAVVLHGQSQAALCYLIAGGAISHSMYAEKDGYDRAARMLEVQLALAPQLLKKTPPGVNPLGSELDVMACCPDVYRAELMVKTRKYASAAPLIERLLAGYDEGLGKLRDETLEQASIDRGEMCEWLVLCYGELLANGDSGQGSSAEMRDALHRASLSAIGEHRNESGGRTFSGTVMKYLPLAFDPLGGVQEIKKMGQVFQAAGSGSSEFLMLVMVRPDERERQSKCSGEEMDQAYQEYLALVRDMPDHDKKAAFVADFSIKRLRNAIRVLRNKELADSIISDIEKLAPLPEDEAEIFVNIQKEYREEFTDEKLRRLPFADIVVAATRGLSALEARLPEKPEEATDEAAGRKEETVAGEEVVEKEERVKPPSCGETADFHWLYGAFIGFLVVCLGLLLRRGRA